MASNEQMDEDVVMTSGDSDFYGDDDLVRDLENRANDIDVQKWWQTHGALDTPLKIQGRSESNLKSSSHLHNPWAGDPYAWQLTESVDEFLGRLPPDTTVVTPSHAWIWVCNPYIKRKSKGAADNQRVRGGEGEIPEDEGADLPKLMQAGEERLHFASAFINQFQQPGMCQALVARESEKAGMDAAKDILELAKGLRVTCGKWMLFCTVFEVNYVWEIIAKATANNELGIGAKVAAKANVDQRKERLICVYTADFSDRKDVVRVARKLKQLGLLKGKPLYYKPDAFTYLGIASGNPWGIKPSIYDTRSLLGQ
ncbi:putative DUF1917-domain-containing protein [Rosellinia necatrix]|uniref:Putative DUF1917-domain-containing protein n=1 Tax=Rosellinia necatrix TaxID=77044 RepID=A0A1W2TNB7_ROSNE|nr:putative DUF1917-domain-containing protein [Rosellinia necatrix]